MSEENTVAQESDSSGEESNTGTFASLEEAEKAYKHLNAAFSKKSNFEKKYNEVLEESKVPDSYVSTQDLADFEEDHINYCAEKAKKLNLTQKQFESFVKETPKKEEPINTLKELGISDSTFKKMSKEEISNLEKVGASSSRQPLNSSTRSISSATSSKEQKKDVMRKMLEARRSGNRNLESSLFNKWESM